MTLISIPGIVHTMVMPLEIPGVILTTAPDGPAPSAIGEAHGATMAGV